MSLQHPSAQDYFNPTLFRKPLLATHNVSDISMSFKFLPRKSQCLLSSVWVLDARAIFYDSSPKCKHFISLQELHCALEHVSHSFYTSYGGEVSYMIKTDCLPQFPWSCTCRVCACPCSRDEGHWTWLASYSGGRGECGNV